MIFFEMSTYQPLSVHMLSKTSVAVARSWPVMTNDDVEGGRATEAR